MRLSILLGGLHGLYYCPHHPDKGFDGEVPSLKFDCDCCKPKPGLLLRAAQNFNIDLSSSWMIGDGKNDVLAGKNAGIHTALTSDTGAEGYGADIVTDSLLDAVERILS